MGQPIVVVQKPSSNTAVVRFETNRPLSGMGHERYVVPPEELLRRPVDELARRLFAVGGVDAVHINGSVVTVSLSPGATGAGLHEAVGSLFRFYPEVPDAEVDAGSATPEAAPPGLEEGAVAPDVAAEPGETTHETTDSAPGPGTGTTPEQPAAAAEPALAETTEEVGPAEGREVEAARRESAAATPEAPEATEADLSAAPDTDDPA
jgi:hypothetical protein